MIRTSATLSLLAIALLSMPANAQDVSEVAHRIARQDCSADAWKKHLKKVRARFATWQNDNPSGSFKRYLDDRLLIHAMSVPAGKIENLKAFMYWLALYKEYQEPPPWYIRLMAKKHGREFAGLLTDFSWQKFSDMITQSKPGTGTNPSNVRQDIKELNKQGRKHGYAAVDDTPPARPASAATTASSKPAPAQQRPAPSNIQTIPLPTMPYLSASHDVDRPAHVPISSQPEPGR